MKSIYKEEDLRCNEVGLDIICKAEEFFHLLLEKYPDHNPREIVGLCIGQFEGISNRKILAWRKAVQAEKHHV